MKYSSSIEISIVIRTYGIEMLSSIIGAIDDQYIANIVVKEIVIVNGNKNCSLEDYGLISRYDLVFLNNFSLPYKPGQALNSGIKRTTGAIIVFLSGHSVPADKNWLISLVAPFSHKKIAGVCGAQIPRNESNYIERLYRAIWYRSNLIGDVFNHFNMANSALRKSYWRLIVFDETLDGCEDRLWAQLVTMKHGGEIKFSSESKVIHSHVCSFVDTIYYFFWLTKISLIALFKLISISVDEQISS